MSDIAEHMNTMAESLKEVIAGTEADIERAKVILRDGIPELRRLKRALAGLLGEKLSKTRAPRKAAPTGRKRGRPRKDAQAPIEHAVEPSEN